MSTQAPQNAFECELQLPWSDQDLNGHVNNARVITLVQEARVLADRISSGTTPDGTAPRVVRKLDVRFDRAVEYASPLVARVWIAGVNNTSYTVCHELAAGRSAGCLRRSRHCAFGRGTRRPTPIPQSLRSNLL